MSQTGANVYEFEDFTLDLSRGALLSAAQNELPLRPKAFALLRLLVENAGRLLDRDTIMTAIWPRVIVTEDSITQCVREIRSVLGDEAQRLLRAVRGRGYILSTTVLLKRASASAVDRDSISFCDQDVGPARVRAPASVRNPLDLSLVVLPFQDLGGDSQEPSLSRSITEDLRVDLSRWVSVGGYPWSEVSGLGATTVIQAVAELGVRYLITGSLRRSLGKLIVTARLIDGKTGACIWADRFANDCSDLEQARDETSTRLAYTLRMALMNTAPRIAGTEGATGADARLFCAQGWSVYNRSVSPIAGEQSLPFFHRALTANPESADARLGIAAVIIRNIAHWWATLDQAAERYVERLLLEALERDPHSSKAYALLGVFRRLQNRMDESLVDTEIAKDLDRNNVLAIRLHAYTLLQTGLPEVAIPQLEKSLRISPHDVDADCAYQVLGTCYLFLNDTNRSIALLRRSRAGNPRLYPTHLLLAAALGLNSGREAAKVPMDDALRLKPELNTLGRLRASIPCPNPGFLGLAEPSLFAGLKQAGMRDDG